MQVWQVGLAMLFPVMLLGLMLLLGHLEETLARDVHKIRRRQPVPIRAVVTTPHPAATTREPELVPVIPVIQLQAPEVTLSPTLSLGGSTNL